MEEPTPFSKLIQAGDEIMLPITGGANPLPATWWTANGELPSSAAAENPSYCIAMGLEAQVHFYQECVGEENYRIWASFVDSVEINLQTEFVECFPYAAFPIEDCGAYEAAVFPGFGRRIYAYCPAGRVKPATISEQLTSIFPGGQQWVKLFG